MKIWIKGVVQTSFSAIARFKIGQTGPRWLASIYNRQFAPSKWTTLIPRITAYGPSEDALKAFLAWLCWVRVLYPQSLTANASATSQVYSKLSLKRRDRSRLIWWTSVRHPFQENGRVYWWISIIIFTCQWRRCAHAQIWTQNHSHSSFNTSVTIVNLI